MFYLDIARLEVLTQSEFGHRMENEYKQGKVYCYIQYDFVREVLYHPVSEDSFQCILKSKIVPP